MKTYIISRLREPSTWAALGALIAAFAPDVGAGVQQAVQVIAGVQQAGGDAAAVGAIVAGAVAVVGVFKREKGAVNHADIKP